MEKLSKKKKIKKVFKKKSDKKKVERKKPDKSKRGRLFIKNLPFKITEQEFKDHFSQFGDIVDVQLLKNADGKLKGCGFINYTKKISAVKAILKSNKKPYKDRTISVDWAVPKTQFEKSKKETEVKKDDKKGDKDQESEGEGDSDDECEVMEANDDVKPESSDIEDASDKEMQSDEDNDSSNDEEDDDSNEDDDSEDDESVKEEDKEEKTAPSETTKAGTKKKVKSNDITEGKTVFLRNLPFHIDNNRLKQLMVSQFGPSLMYALVCMDPLTEHSKGTAFVKFKTVEQAQDCVNKGSLQVDGETVTLHAAMDRKQLDLQKETKDKRFKDSRNLYLVKEGVVLAGSRAAADVSVADMTKRVQLEQWKTGLLRNLHMFISKTRLIVHNLPPEWNDAQLRTMVKKYGPPGAVIREAKVMRNIRDVDEKGVGRSKEHGFVSFTSHEDALQALRNINNNPNVFTRAKRPIVAFSIENRAILNAKLKRTERSKQNNPLYKEKYKEEKKQQATQGKQQKQKYSVKDTKQRRVENSNEEGSEFTGQVARPSQNITFPKKHKLTQQLQTHRGQMQQNKKQQRQQKRRNMNKAKTKDSVKTKPNTANKKLSDDKQFSKLISSYKSKISSASANNTPGFKRWYDA